MNSTSHRHVFKPRARLLLLLGDELIRDEAMAVFELVKNAYDADARVCLIEMNNIESSDQDLANIIVEDDGSGMDINIINEVWLEPGTSHRKDQRNDNNRSPTFDRLPIGEKGVGRFAVHKLGLKTEIVTRMANKNEVVINIDWSDFESERYLSDVGIKIVERKPLYFKGKATGTRIEVTQLRTLPWSRRKVRWLYRSLTSINSPFGANADFSTSMELSPKNDWLSKLLSPKDVFKHAICRFEGVLNGTTLDYQYSFTPPDDLKDMGGRKNTIKNFPLIAQEDFETNAPKRSKSSFSLPKGSPQGDTTRGVSTVDLDEFDLRNIKVVLYIYDLDSAVLKMSVSDPKGLKDYMNENGGVKIYRNGVRVYDFGEPGNDWLDIEGRRVNVPTKRLGNNQILGAVFLDFDHSKQLVEKTNREGFVENKAYRAFQEAIKCAVTQAAAERNRDKEAIRKRLAPKKKFQPVLDELSDLREELRRQKINGEVTPIIDRVEHQYREMSEQLLLSAGAGLNLAAIMHQVEKDVDVLAKALENNSPRKNILKISKRLSEMTDTMSWLLRDSPRAKLPASFLISHAIDTWPFRFDSHNINVINGMKLDEPDPDFSIKGSRRLLMTALLNLIDNSIYWLNTQSVKRKLYIGTTFEFTGKPSIVVADNGPGFSDTLEDVVKPFFSRKPTGSGLGLHIASEIMKNHGGRLAEIDSSDITLPSQYDGAVLLMEFPRAPQ